MKIIISSPDWGTGAWLLFGIVLFLIWMFAPFVTVLIKDLLTGELFKPQERSDWSIELDRMAKEGKKKMEQMKKQNAK